MKTLAMMFGSNGLGSPRLMAEALRRMGRRGDTVLAHITPEEADMLMQAGGAGSINPDTGLPEFARRDYGDFDDAGDFVRNTQSDVLSAIQRQPVTGTTRGESVPMDVGFESRPLERTVRADMQQQRLNPQVDYTAGLGSRYQQEQRIYPEVDFTPKPERQVFPTDFQTTRLPQYERVDFGRIPEYRELQDKTVVGERSLAQRAESGLQELRDLLDRYPNLTRAGTAGANILAQTLLFNQANREMQRAVEETRRAAQPFREAQAEAMSRATGEGLTPEQQQELETEQARARQGLTERNLQTGSAASGILAAQARRARSIARKSSFDEALRLANIADQYDRRALELELQRDQQLAQLFAGILGREVQQAQRTQAPVPETGR